MLTVEGLAKGYGGPPVFTDVRFDVGRGERLLVMGLNGAGKTSLLRILAGETDADAARSARARRRARLLRAGARGDPRRRDGAGARPSASRPMRATRTSAALLGMFGLTGDVAFQDAGTLSGGEKTKLALAQLVAGRQNLLLLDEPTNNLDPPSRTAVAEALAGVAGRDGAREPRRRSSSEPCPATGADDARRGRSTTGATTSCELVALA